MKPVDHPAYVMLQRIVAGQIRSYMVDHPDSISETFRVRAARGITKRVVHDLWAQRERLISVLEPRTGVDSAGRGKLTCDQPSGGDAESDAASPGAGGGTAPAAGSLSAHDGERP